MKSRWIFRLYNFLVLLSLPFILLGVILRWRKRVARGMDRWQERWGRLSPETRAKFSGGEWWWVHAVSLGEVKSIEVFLKEIPKQAHARVLLSVVTPEALAWADEKQLADVVIAAPVDLPWVVRRIARAVKPRLFISVESEFWPNLLREAKRAGAKVALVNGRISARSYNRYKYIQGILSAVWECFDLVIVRQHEDASRFNDLGVPQRLVHVSGNMKYDLPLPHRSNGQNTRDPSRLTIVIGSSRAGEEKELLPILERLRSPYPGLRVIWAPRHVERISEIESLFASQSVPCVRKSLGSYSEASSVLWDSMGDLLDAYAQADIAVIGGSFVPNGGQNPLEPAAMSVPVVFGPSMENFRGIAEVLVQQGGASQVTLPEIEHCLSELLQNREARQDMGARARRAIESRQGATNRSLVLLKRLIGA
jgi:3-deoxy-D-manno-octulosonic-acid transferase